ncbi:ALG6, ALG8 glycosyltransferase [Metschnikowia bicuspidata var. bicuspidata NRRL YB-4993]|uniref:Alpha-1,3-glucosyltransferase n=1 Tax=Metschnikowia bicuspidata var. bicuspidata NRRL YB-4993 TaxID=869754 RepID=A0A1A0H562_9ASCO|nr:ALG6, ALG8 glycosyltransferase [Metschnikowia bicuspidata var. bicuspidata NRRL YB-4993]OBA19047.1 ALG6, ALG8 glycosyltransferase [Metschnikowia bicuspidata var. bicuspidata NRRL YB-4993]
MVRHLQKKHKNSNYLRSGPSEQQGTGSKKDLSSSVKKPNPFTGSPLYDLLQVFERPQDQWVARYILILSIVLLKASVGLGLFSGQGELPINGDFEAQRHWMELTIHIPLTSWYFFDLRYWGLDYPPLTAYHLWAFGKIGSFLNPEWFVLGLSRGNESVLLKTFMRLSCLLSELVFYVPAVMQLTSYLGGRKENLSRIHQIVVLALIFCQPCLILIDNGHFQYNSVMLGLFLFSVIELLKGNLVLASVWFICSILFKQMALYYSPFIFVFILSRLFTCKKTISSTIATFQFGKLFVVSVTVVVTITVILFPFLIAARSGTEAAEQVLQILKRMFPFERGLFEDKVANFWCTSNILIKYATIFNGGELKAISLILTLTAIFPPCAMIFWKNIRRLYPPPELAIYGFSATAWAFFLFLFQVHEKTVLVPLIPSTLLLLTDNSSCISVIQWINNIAAFSLYPLLKKDGLVLQYLVCTLLVNWLLGGFLRKNWKSLLMPNLQSQALKFVIILSYMAVFAVHVLDFVITPPMQYPDLWTIANTTVSFGSFSWFYLWLLYKIYHL